MVKEIKIWGKTEEELKKMDVKQIMPFLPARRRRSLKRGLTEAQKRLQLKLESGDNNIKTHCRDMIIIPSMIGKAFRVYNGKEYFPFTVTSEMIGHLLGEFAPTRRPVAHSAAGVGATRSSKGTSAR